MSMFFFFFRARHTLVDVTALFFKLLITERKVLQVSDLNVSLHVLFDFLSVV